MCACACASSGFVIKHGLLGVCEATRVGGRSISLWCATFSLGHEKLIVLTALIMFAKLFAIFPASRVPHWRWLCQNRPRLILIRNIVTVHRQARVHLPPSDDIVKLMSPHIQTTQTILANVSARKTFVTDAGPSDGCTEVANSFGKRIT